MRQSSSDARRRRPTGRKARAAALRQQRRRRAFQTGAAVALVATAGVVGLVVAATGSGSPAATGTSTTAGVVTSLLPTTTAVELDVERFEGLSRNHTTGRVRYAQRPPVGGDHHPDPQPCGLYDAPVPDERAVHSLEHGAVWLTYRPDLPVAQVDRLRAWAPVGYVLVSPYAGQTDPVVATAWGVQMRLANADEVLLRRFIDSHKLSSGAPEAGGPC